LHGRRAHTSTRPEDEGSFTGPGSSSLEQTDPARQENDRDPGSHRRRERRRIGEQLVRFDYHIVRIASIPEKRCRSIAFSPPPYILANPDNLPCHLETGAVRTRRDGPVHSQPHDEIREIDSGRIDTQVDFTRARVPEWDLSLDEDLRRTETLDQYCACAAHRFTGVCTGIPTGSRVFRTDSRNLRWFHASG